MTNPEHVAVLGKLAEETAELSNIIARCLIQGIDESEPVTGALNRHELEKEIADVEAMIAHVKQRFRLDGPFIEQRSQKKFSTKAVWFDRLKLVFGGTLQP